MLKLFNLFLVYVEKNHQICSIQKQSNTMTQEELDQHILDEVAATGNLYDRDEMLDRMEARGE